MLNILMKDCILQWTMYVATIWDKGLTIHNLDVSYILPLLYHNTVMYS